LKRKVLHAETSNAYVIPALSVLFLVLAGLGLALPFGLGVNGVGGVFSIRDSTSSRVGDFGMDTDLESLDPYFLLLGKFSHNWANMETGLTATNAVIYHRLGGKENIKQELPRTQYRRKATYLRCAVKRLPALRKWRSQVEHLLNKTDSLAADRHLFTHGSPQGFEAPERVEIWLLSIQSDDTLADKGRPVTWAELEALGSQAEEYAQEMLDLTEAIIREVKDNADNAPRKVPMKLAGFLPVPQFAANALCKLLKRIR
jgi:hypothetical protein